MSAYARNSESQGILCISFNHLILLLLLLLLLLLSLLSCRQHETEKKRQYANRILELEQATFTPLVFSTTGGMGVECKRYHSSLAELGAAKKGESYATTMSWIRARVSFALLRSALLCLRGSRARRRIYLELSDIDFDIEKGHANIR